MSATTPDTWRKPPAIANPVLRYGLMLAGAVSVLGALSTLPFDWNRISEGIGRAGRIFAGAFPPNFARPSLMIEGFLESLQIAIIATAAGVLLSVPIALMAARNLAPMPVYLLGRGIIICARSFHPVIVAIIFVKAVGFGALAGMQVEAVRSAGATYLSTLIYAVFPQIMPRQIGLSIYQLDSNLRASAVVGIVGAGGIGATLANAFKRYDYDFALAIIIVIVGAILISEAVSGMIRKRIW
jgi:phosphonate transport system permease protein